MEHDLKAALKAKGMTQQQLADHLGIKQSSVSIWANGKMPVPQGRLDELRDLLGYVPTVGKGSAEWEDAIDDPGTFLRQGPLGFLVLVGFPKDVEMPYPRPTDLERWKLKTWAAHLGVSEGQLVSQIAGRMPITVRQLELVAEQGIKFFALADLVGNPYAAEDVAVWFADNSPFESFKALRNAAAVRMLEEKGAYDGLGAVDWPKGAYDMDQLWAESQELGAE